VSGVILSLVWKQSSLRAFNHIDILKSCALEGMEVLLVQHGWVIISLLKLFNLFISLVFLGNVSLL
jgi:hypothetical protein